MIMVLMITGFSTKSFGKGCTGNYIITGIMYGADKKPLANQKFIINGQSIVTDNTGRYLVYISYRTSDRYRKVIQRWKVNNTINEPSIQFSYNQTNKHIKNNWRKYGLRYCFKGTVYILTKNFYWKK